MFAYTNKHFYILSEKLIRKYFSGDMCTKMGGREGKSVSVYSWNWNLTLCRIRLLIKYHNSRETVVETLNSFYWLTEQFMLVWLYWWLKTTKSSGVVCCRSMTARSVFCTQDKLLSLMHWHFADNKKKQSKQVSLCEVAKKIQVIWWWCWCIVDDSRKVLIIILFVIKSIINYSALAAD